MRRILRSGGLVAFGAIVLSTLGLLAVPRPTQAQSDPVMTLDASTQSIDVQITPTNQAAGVVDVEMDGVLLQLRDSNNIEVTTASDRRITRLSLEFANGSAPHTLHLERLPGVETARVLVSSRATLPDTFVTAAPGPLTVLNAPEAGRVVAAPSMRLPIVISAGADFLNIGLPARDSMLQLSDSLGGLMLNLAGGSQIAGIAVRLSPGQYNLVYVSRDLTARNELVLTLSPAPLSSMAPQTVAAVNPTATSGCAATVNVASAQVRSGPGTAYTVLGHATQNAMLPVGGTAVGGGWLLVEIPGVSGWISQSAVQLSGPCNALTSFNIPVRNAVAIAQPTNPASTTGGQSNYLSEGQGNDD